MYCTRTLESYWFEDSCQYCYRFSLLFRNRRCRRRTTGANSHAFYRRSALRTPRRAKQNKLGRRAAAALLLWRQRASQAVALLHPVALPHCFRKFRRRHSPEATLQCVPRHPEQTDRHNIPCSVQSIWHCCTTLVFLFVQTSELSLCSYCYLLLLHPSCQLHSNHLTTQFWYPRITAQRHDNQKCLICRLLRFWL